MSVTNELFCEQPATTETAETVSVVSLNLLKLLAVKLQCSWITSSSLVEMSKENIKTFKEFITLHNY